MRQAASRLLRQGVRSISTSAARLEGEAAPAGVKEFTEQWNKVAPSTLNLPEFPSSFLPPEQSAEAAVDGERFSVNFYTPHGVVAQAKVGGNLRSLVATAPVACNQGSDEAMNVQFTAAYYCTCAGWAGVTLDQAAWLL